MTDAIADDIRIKIAQAGVDYAKGLPRSPSLSSEDILVAFENTLVKLGLRDQDTPPLWLIDFTRAASGALLGRLIGSELGSFFRGEEKYAPSLEDI